MFGSSIRRRLKISIYLIVIKLAAIDNVCNLLHQNKKAPEGAF